MSKPKPQIIEEKPRRIAKAMADSGLCSRREAERTIAEGNVSVNGVILKSPALNVTSTDTILVNGKPLAPMQPVKLWRYYKPAGLVVSNKDEKGRDTIFDKLPKDLPRTMSVGRLDIATEGLLLLTTNGELARHLELPATGWLRRYRVRAKGTVTEKLLVKLAQGVTIEGVRYKPITAVLDRQQGANCWLTMAISEGKNREIRKVCTYLGLEVNRLIRLSYGPFSLQNMKVGELIEVKSRIIADQIGPQLANQFGLNNQGHAKAKDKTPSKSFSKPRRKPANRSNKNGKTQGKPFKPHGKPPSTRGKQTSHAHSKRRPKQSGRKMKSS